jgi:hypothetical protein
MKTKKKLTRKQAEKILAKAYNIPKYNTDLVEPLCFFIPTELHDEWNRYWKKINTKRRKLMWNYYLDDEEFYTKDYRQEVTFLRLLTAHLFIKHVYGEE